MDENSLKKKKAENLNEYMKNYMKKYNENRYDQIYKYVICEVCGGKYMYNSKTHHLKSKNHVIGELQKKLNQIQTISK